MNNFLCDFNFDFDLSTGGSLQTDYVYDESSGYSLAFYRYHIINLILCVLILLHFYLWADCSLSIFIQDFNSGSVYIHLIILDMEANCNYLMPFR